MFLGWAFDSGLAGEFHLEECKEEYEAFKRREMTATEILMMNCDGKLTDEDLNDEGNDFATFYYEKGNYLQNYDLIFSACKSVYHVEDSWENYVLVKNMIDKKFKSWKRCNRKKWYEFWK